MVSSLNSPRNPRNAMTFIPAPSVCQVEFVYTWSSQTVETVLHFEPTVVLTPTLMNELAVKVLSLWTTNVKPLLINTISLINVKLTDLTTNIAPVVNYATGLPSAGTQTGDSLPNNCALVITKRTLLRGRSYRGRIYHPGIPEAQCTGNVVTAAFVTQIVNAYATMLTFTTTGTTWDMVVVSRYNNNSPRAEADSNQVTGLGSDGLIDSQRRRLPGRGA